MIQDVGVDEHRQNRKPSLQQYLRIFLQIHHLLLERSPLHIHQCCLFLQNPSSQGPAHSVSGTVGTCAGQTDVSTYFSIFLILPDRKMTSADGRPAWLKAVQPFVLGGTAGCLATVVVRANVLSTCIF